MKKTFTVVAVVLAFGAVAAFAGTISIPQFNDRGGQTSPSTLFSADYQATWITVTNVTDTDKVITINYYLLNGTPDGTSTWLMGAKKAVSWRPVAVDTNEADAIPSPSTSIGPGWCQILYPGTAADVCGRVFQNSAATQTSFGFTLMPYD
ncbi:MAG: hypothetical protein K1Y02_10810 [Candidatus Hydrogenedentes bacterium]|nr:hypothetical protein [Candidatus Hydrogenedentota bacterium]